MKKIGQWRKNWQLEDRSEKIIKLLFKNESIINKFSKQIGESVYILIDYEKKL